ncbi:AAA family ATPase [Roseibium sp. FZY0029]|uniref:AAA family ATPase n=1 Tax=Roseibium sp. FZY0029 TaxID=3116647 RepID=UPI002EB8A0C4|nr:AAA family ATPase [Roseibium sp. FZY0029]
MPSKITNLKKMQKMGIFADRLANAASLELRKFNLIYGFNGSGKTTLSRLFASMENGELNAK